MNHDGVEVRGDCVERGHLGGHFVHSDHALTNKDDEID